MSDMTLDSTLTKPNLPIDKQSKWTPRAASPLDHVEIMQPAQSYRDVSVEIKEIKGLTHLVLRGKSEDPAFIYGVEQAIGIELPITPGTSVQDDALRVFWQSPDEWLIIAKPNLACGIEAALHKHLVGHYAVTEVSSGQTLVTLSGENAENVIKKSTLYDVHIRQFPVGRVVGTNFAKSQVQIRRVSEKAFELIIRRSFADYIWMWLMDAGREYGVAFHKH